MALKLADHPHHKAPEVKPFQAAEPAGEWVPGGERGETLDFVPAEAEADPPRDPPPPDYDPPPEPQPDPYWRDMQDAPRNRPIYTTADPERDADGTLTYWRETREKINGHKGWIPIAYWAAVLSRQKLGFEPAGWRESMVQRETVTA